MTNKVFILFFSFICLVSCKNNSNKKFDPDAKTEMQSAAATKTSPLTSDTLLINAAIQPLGWSELKKYIGTYSKDTDFFENPIVKNELKRILGNNFKPYQEHITLSGCGEINYKYELMYGDVSQLHVGGYSSLFFIDTKARKMYLFWLTETVRDKKYKIYGDSPIPANVLSIIAEEMNIGWGHVATFTVSADSIHIELKE